MKLNTHSDARVRNVYSYTTLNPHVRLIKHRNVAFLSYMLILATRPTTVAVALDCFVLEHTIWSHKPIKGWRSLIYTPILTSNSLGNVQSVKVLVRFLCYSNQILETCVF